MSSHVLRELVLFGKYQGQIWDETAVLSPNIVPGELVAQLQLLKVYCVEYDHLQSQQCLEGVNCRKRQCAMAVDAANGIRNGPGTGVLPVLFGLSQVGPSQALIWAVWAARGR